MGIARIQIVRCAETQNPHRLKGAPTCGLAIHFATPGAWEQGGESARAAGSPEPAPSSEVSRPSRKATIAGMIGIPSRILLLYQWYVFVVLIARKVWRARILRARRRERGAGVPGEGREKICRPNPSQFLGSNVSHVTRAANACLRRCEV